ncbi:hypothetical protein SAMN05216249_12018 [Acetitomaculum ruminis DSM 5522]|uniref:Cof subfamily of IIB subfamily of haloacid dehalogenase superfamily/HAD-superfamily hydrolase, subfamily IIB n=1 Tax=Acetitomaculum ruminis DSM 5522 TaxID=1120918 RepID=A0A1I1A6C7_9FIRM|nr:HAD family hydrolase [Acetitomaculum ruminis]SFB31963.1 hypothetical protein SAMN05216249_12018 [Acetitomaculum ruminis DSM 5522]
MIKLIATDIDDTLLPNATAYITPEIEDMILQLKKKGIIFVAATGRQYEGVRKTFKNVKDDIVYICENGAEMYVPGKAFKKKTIPMNYARGIINDYRKYKNSEKSWKGTDFLVSTGKGVFIERPTDEFRDIVGNKMNYQYHAIDSFDELEEDAEILKISLYCQEGVLDIAKKLIPKWKDKVNICQGGKTWLPAMNKEADKGLAIKKLSQIYNLTPDEMMAFGDGGNDIGMFKQVKYSFAAENSESFVKDAAKGIFEPAIKGGVYKKIKEMVL